MELRQLRYFIKVAEQLNFSEAAKQLNITQSTLSLQIKQLESEIGTQLLNRSSHSVTLTEAGTELLPLARRTLTDAQICTDRINDLNNLATGTLTIGVTYSFSPILTETLVAFMKMHPHIKLNIFYKPMAELMEMLRARQVDFVLAFKPSEPIEGIESHILFQNSLSAIVGEFHPLASRQKITPAELLRYDLALPSRGLQARNAFDHLLAPYGNFRVRIELNEVNILITLLRQTSLVPVLAEATINNERGVKAIPLDIPDRMMAGCVHILTDAYRKKSMHKFIEMLSDSVA
ncbi:MAG: LysR family transcriptional regulator, partial [Muribaculaceae bacterium]|nr:LysR family transcriptional regulator [Muribaculaceae bacterium]